MHRLTALIAGVSLIGVGLLTQNIPAVGGMLLAGTFMLSIAIRGKPQSSLPVWLEFVLLIAVIAISVGIISFVAYLID